MHWIRYFGNRANATDAAVRLDSDGNIITYSAYKESSYPTLYGQFMLTKWSPSGDIIWQKRSHYGRNYYVGDFEVLPDNSIIAVGSHDGGGELMRFSAEGDSLWTRQYVAFATSERHRLFDVEPTSDGGFVAAGSCDQYWGDPTPNLETEWMIKTDSLGCVVPGCHTAGVQEYALDLNQYLSISPNPVAPGQPLHISFEPPPTFTPNGPLRLVMLDALGRHVQEEHLRGTAGQLTTGNWQPGLYYMHIADAKRWLAGGKVVVE
ncbi:MAG: hypothetical protein IPM12_13005 [Flavobacteriales bacterium]|nr:hypothetical protein [Flavobacteriales bacterium]